MMRLRREGKRPVIRIQLSVWCVGESTWSAFVSAVASLPPLPAFSLHSVTSGQVGATSAELAIAGLVRIGDIAVFQF